MAAETVPVIVVNEKTTLAVSATQAGTYTALGAEVTSIGLPGAEQSEVPTWGLGSALKTTRPGQIPDFGTVQIKLFADPNFSGHAALRTAASNGATLWFKITYADGMTTHATDVFSAWVKSFKPTAIEGEKNVEWTIDLRINSIPVFTTGTTP